MTTPSRSVPVRLLIFSGRPDPEWIVEGDALDALAERARAAVGKERAYPPQPGGLGYRGFLVRNEAVPDLPSEFLVFHGAIIERPGPAARYWRDAAGLEEWLLDEARRHGHREVLAAAGVWPPDTGTA
jgi:hypothetical protein